MVETGASLLGGVGCVTYSGDSCMAYSGDSMNTPPQSKWFRDAPGSRYVQMCVWALAYSTADNLRASSQIQTVSR